MNLRINKTMNRLICKCGKSKTSKAKVCAECHISNLRNNVYRSQNKKICTICLDLGDHTNKEHQVNLLTNPPTSIERENESLRKQLNSLMEIIKDEPEGYFQSAEFYDMDPGYRLKHFIERLLKEKSK